MTLDMNDKSVLICLVLCIACSEGKSFGELGEDIARSELTTKCLSDIVFRYPRDELIFIFKGNTSADRMRTKRPTIIMTEIKGRLKCCESRHRGVLQLFNQISLVTVLDTVNWKSETKFIVFTEGSSSVEAILSQFWMYRVLNVVVVVRGPSSKFMDAFTYFPYSEDHCESVGRLVRLGSCSAAGEITEELFPNKMENLHGCPLIMSLVERAPAVINIDGVPDGVETNILKMIASSLNATPTFLFLKSKTRLYSKIGNSILRELVENHSHLVAGSLIYTDSMHAESDGIEYPVSMCITVAVPKQTHASYSYIFQHILPGHIFIGMIAGSLFAIICTYLFSKVLNPYTSLKKTIQFCLYSPRNNTYTTVRVFFAFWLLTSFLLNIMFDASVSSSALARKPIPQFESLEEVFQSGLLVDGEGFMLYDALKLHLPEKVSRGFCGCALKKSLVLIAEEGDRAFIEARFNIMYHLAVMQEIEPKVHVQKKCIMHFRPVIQVRKRSPFTKSLKRFITALGESGIIQWSFEKYDREIIKHQHRPEENIRSLTLNDLKTGFWFLFLGLSGSFLFLVLEILCHKLLNLLQFQWHRS